MKNLYKALANFQQECPIIHKDTTGYGYTYADLPKIFEVITPILKKNGLGIAQPIRGKEIETVLFHIESGESIVASMDIPQDVELKGMNDFQVLGSAITYLRRYALSSMLGLVTDKDLDAAGEQVSKSTPKPSTKAPVTPQVSQLTDSDDPFEGIVEQFGGHEVKQPKGHICASCGTEYTPKPGTESFSTLCVKCFIASKK